MQVYNSAWLNGPDTVSAGYGLNVDMTVDHKNGTYDL